MRVVLEEIRYGVEQADFVGGRLPYSHQRATLAAVRQTLATGETRCIVNSSATGSGKTLANFAATILDGVPAIGVYGTKELIEDQARSLEAEPGPRPLFRVDSDALDRLQGELEIRSHVEVLNLMLGSWQAPVMLTNPDILHLIMFNAFGYGNKAMSYRDRVFWHVVGNYPILVFDEFHLYDVKQTANVAFIVGAISRLAGNKPHVFLFSSATPTDVTTYCERLGLDVVDVSSSPTAQGRVVGEEIEVTLVATDLARWEGAEAVSSLLPEVLELAEGGGSRGVFILDSVYDARRLSAQLAALYGQTAVGEVHGYMDRRDRAGGLEKRFTVGTTTIDVGVDLTGPKAKEFIVFEARSAEQFVQRLGRLGRRGREARLIDPPNRAWALVPPYVYKCLQKELGEQSCPAERVGRVGRQEFFRLIRMAYRQKQDFRQYVVKYSPLEAVAATRRVVGHALSDQVDETSQKLYGVVLDLFRPTLPKDRCEGGLPRAALALIAEQRAVWEELGETGRPAGAASADLYVPELESFRSSDYFAVAIHDLADEAGGLMPFKLYDLPFVLRRTVFEEMRLARFEDSVRRRLGAEADAWLRRMRRQRPLGTVRVDGVKDGLARKFWFEIPRCSVMDLQEVVVRIGGFRLNGEALPSLEGINSSLARRALLCWISMRDPFGLAIEYNLPAMFRVYPLRPVNAAGRSVVGNTFWSVCFGREAFLISAVRRRSEGHLVV